MSCYDDPESLKRFMESMKLRPPSRYEPPSRAIAHEQDVDEQLHNLESSTSSVDVPAHMYHATHDLRSAFAGDASTTPIGSSEVSNGFDNTSRDFGRTIPLEYVRAQLATPEDYIPAYDTAEANSDNTSRRSEPESVTIGVGLEGSIHAHPSASVLLAQHNMTSGLGSSYGSIRTLPGGIDILSQSGRAQSQLSPAVPSPEAEEFEVVLREDTPEPNDTLWPTNASHLATDARLILDAASAFSTSFNQRERRPNAQNDLPPGAPESDKDSSHSSIEQGPLEARRIEIVEAAARVGCLKRVVADRLSLPVKDASPPGKGLSNVQDLLKEELAKRKSESPSPSDPVQESLARPRNRENPDGYEVIEAATVNELYPNLLSPPPSPPPTIDETGGLVNERLSLSPTQLSPALKTSDGYTPPSPDKQVHKRVSFASMDDELHGDKAAMSDKTLQGEVQKKASFARDEHIPSQSSASTEPDLAASSKLEPIYGQEKAFDTQAYRTKTIKPASRPVTDADRANETSNYFANWPSIEARARPAAKIRRVIIKNLPSLVTERFIASLVYGGMVEAMSIRPGAAEVLFVDADACERYCADTENGLVYGYEPDGKEKFVIVEKAPYVDVEASRIRELVDNGATRCVHAVGRDFNVKVSDVTSKEPISRMKIEHVVDQNPTPKGFRRVIFRMCNISDANILKAYLERHEDWECFNIGFTPDPCEGARNEPPKA